MSVRIQDIWDVSVQYVRRQVDRARSMVDGAPDPVKRYQLGGEPPSAMFCKSAEVHVVGIENARDPLEAQVISEVRGEWNSHAEQMIAELRSYGINVEDFARTGGVYQTTIPNKKIRKQFKYQSALLQSALDFWRCPEWEEVAKQKTLRLLDDYTERAHYNLERLKLDPTSLTTGKPGATGTGYIYPWDTRENMQDNFDTIAPVLGDLATGFMADLREAVEAWPSNGATITIGGPFKGVSGGRSDADVVSWEGNFQRIASMTRDVGTVPTSVLHNRSLDREWQSELWARHLTPYHYAPQDIEGMAKALTIPPATMPGDDPEEVVMMSFDFGYVSDAPLWDGKRLIIPKERLSFGADNMTLFGINLYSLNANKYYGMLVSGAPFTMIIYLTMVGWVIAAWLERQGITPAEFRMWQIGDDLQIMTKRKHIPAFLARFGNYVRGKGMSVNTTGYTHFVTGRYVTWHDRNTITVFMEPRYLKTVSSANVLKEGSLVPESIQVGDTFRMVVDDPDVIAQIDQFWENYSWAILYHGTPEEYFNLLTDSGVEALNAQVMIDAGFTAEIFADWDMSDTRREELNLPGTRNQIAAEEKATDGGRTSDAINETQRAINEHEEGLVRPGCQQLDDDTGIRRCPVYGMCGYPADRQSECDRYVSPPASEEREQDASDDPDPVGPPASESGRAVYVTGQPGSGKTTIKSMLMRHYPVIDLDEYGKHPEGDPDVWVVDPEDIRPLIKGDTILLGMSNNYKDFTAAYPWVLLHFEGTEEEYTERLAQRVAEGKNSWGTEPGQASAAYAYRDVLLAEAEKDNAIIVRIFKEDSPEVTADAVLRAVSDSLGLQKTTSEAPQIEVTPGDDAAEAAAEADAE